MITIRVDACTSATVIVSVFVRDNYAGKLAFGIEDWFTFDASMQRGFGSNYVLTTTTNFSEEFITYANRIPQR